MYLEREIGDYRIYSKAITDRDGNPATEYVVTNCLSVIKHKEIEIGHFATLADADAFARSKT